MSVQPPAVCPVYMAGTSEEDVCQSHQQEEACDLQWQAGWPGGLGCHCRPNQIRGSSMRALRAVVRLP